MVSQTDPQPLQSMLCFAVYAAEHAFTRFYKPRLDALGLTYPQYLACIVLWESDNITVKALGDRLFLDSGTVTPLLKRLEARGLVSRQRDSEDERQVRIVLTQAGRDLQARALAVPLAVGTALGGTPDQADALRTALDDLRQRLDAAR